MKLEDEMRWSREYRIEQDKTEQVPSLPKVLLTSMIDGIKISRSSKEISGVIATTALTAVFTALSAAEDLATDVMASLKTAAGR